MDEDHGWLREGDGGGDWTWAAGISRLLVADHPWALTMAPDDLISELSELGKGEFEAVVK
jgi:hypothetical protein